MKLRILGPFKTKQAHFREAENEYLKRLKAWAKVELVEQSFGHSQSLPPEKRLLNEAAFLSSKLNRSDFVVVLDPPGKKMTSEALSKFIETKMLDGNSTLAFVVGGAHGLAKSIKDRGNLSLSLSSLTFGHSLARLMLIEQLYRAISIIKGSPYHK